MGGFEFFLWCQPEQADDYIDGLLQDCIISSVLALEILHSCTKPSRWSSCHWIEMMIGAVKWPLCPSQAKKPAFLVLSGAVLINFCGIRALHYGCSCGTPVWKVISTSLAGPDWLHWNMNHSDMTELQCYSWSLYFACIYVTHKKHVVIDTYSHSWIISFTLAFQKTHFSLCLKSLSWHDVWELSSLLHVLTEIGA